MKLVFDRSRKSASKAIATLVVAIIGFFAIARAGYKTVAILILVLGIILAGWLSPGLAATLVALVAIVVLLLDFCSGPKRCQNALLFGAAQTAPVPSQL